MNSEEKVADWWRVEAEDGLITSAKVLTLLTPTFSVTCIGDISVHLSTCYLNGCLTVKQGIFYIISGKTDK